MTRAVQTALAGAGGVLQVVQGTSTAATITSSTAFVDTTLSATITPTSATSKILVCVVHGVSGVDTATNNGIYWNLLRNSTSIFTDGGTFSHPSTFTYIYGQGWVAYYLDSPATTSATTYKTQVKSPNATQINVDYQGTAGKITLMEIAG